MFDANSTGISVSNPKLFADFAPGFTDGIRYCWAIAGIAQLGERMAK